jgi:hypothetical protein
VNDSGIDWLPPLVLLESFDGDVGKYLSAVKAIFNRDFMGDRPPFRGKRMGLKRMPEHDGMSATFWHFISSGPVEADRLPDLRRWERIGWPMAMIQAVDTDKVRTWEEEDPKRGAKVLIALPDFSYLVVLDVRGDFVLPWTAYPVEQDHTRRKLQQRCSAATSQKS